MPDVEIRGQRIFFDDRGQGMPIILGHSFLCDHEMWAPQAAALSASYRVINMDIRGHGKSGPVTVPFSLADMADDVAGVLDHLGIARAVWGGLSIGGMVALQGALNHPDRVAALILADTTAEAEGGFRRFKYGAMAFGLRLFGPKPFLSEVCKLMFGPTTRARQPDLVDTWRERFAGVHVPSILQMTKALNGRTNLLDKLSMIDVPACVFVGAEDASLPPARSRALSGGLANAELHIIEDAGHLSSLEQPDAVTSVIHGFLDRLDRQ